MKSELRQMGLVSFPENIGERIYMVPFVKTLPAHLSRWQLTVDQMLDGLTVMGPCYLMVDQSIVEAGATHRRKGLHVDGNWLPGLSCHGNPDPYGPQPGHGHAPPPRPHHMHMGGRWDNPAPGWKQWNYQPEAILLATDVLGCAAYIGELSGPIGSGGEYGGDIKQLDRIELEPGRAWGGNVTMLHESLPLVTRDARTVVRINAPGCAPKTTGES